MTHIQRTQQMVIYTEQQTLVDEGIGLVILATEYEVQYSTTHYNTPHHTMT